MDVGSVGKAIAYLRKRAGYTQKDLADRLGVSDKAVSKWERGLGLPDISFLGNLAILLDTDTDSLLSGDVIHHDKGWHGLLILEENEEGIGPETVIYDKPLLYYLLSYYLLVGIRNIKVICDDSYRKYIETEIIEGHDFDISLSFGTRVTDAATDDSFMDCDSLMILFGRSLIYGVDQTRFFQKAMVNRNHITVLALPKGTRDASTVVRFDANKKIVPAEHEDCLKTQYNYCDIPVAFCPQKVFFEGCHNAEHAYDVSWIFQHQDVYIEALDRGFVEIDLSTREAVAEASEFVKIVQDHCGMIIYCLEEVAWRRGMLSNENIRRRAEKMKDTGYGKYIMKMIENREVKGKF